MPIYPSKTKGKWRVTIFAHGKQREWTVIGTKNEAKSFEAKKRIALDLERPSIRASPSFDHFIETVYAPHAVLHLRDSTWSKVRVYQVNTLRERLGKLKLTQIDSDVVDRYKQARAGDTVREGNERKVAASSINNELRVLKTILRFAAKRKYPTAVPDWEKLPSRGTGRVKAWTPDEIKALLVAAKAKTPEIIPLLFFIAQTGVRKGEAIACEWSWVNFARDRLEIPVNEAWQPKSGKPREVPLSTPLRAMLEGERKHERWVFPNTLGDRWLSFPEELWRRARDEAGLSGGPHQLRHSYASLFLQSVPDLFLLGQVLGHSTQRMTELYSHLLPGHLERAKDAVRFDLP